MDVKSFYDSIGGNYADALSRLMNDALITRFLGKFKATQNLDALKEAINNNDLEKVFTEAHTLKGVALNLSLSKLGNAASDLTELLRGDNKNSADLATVKSLFEKIEVYYNEVISKID